MKFKEQQNNINTVNDIVYPTMSNNPLIFIKFLAKKINII